MSQILIRNIGEDIIERLKARAKQSGRSLESEARLILERAAGVRFSDAPKISKQWRKRLSDRSFPNTATLIREDRAR